MADKSLDERVLALEIKLDLLDRQVAQIVEALTKLPTPQQGKAAPTTPEELRQAKIEGIDRILEGGRIVHAFLRDDGLRMLRVDREYTRTATSGDMQRYYDLWKAEP